MEQITKEVLAQWRKKAQNTERQSALGEYTPPEFLELLNYHEARIEALEADVIHARRVAGERQVKIDELQAVIDKVNEELEEERLSRLSWKAWGERITPEDE